LFCKDDGLKSKIPAGKRAVGNSGYAGKPEHVTVKSHLDSDAVKALKRRAQACHNTFHGRIEKLKILDERFFHGLKKHKAAFETACIIMQYDLENGNPLFDA
jgi:hypothetical protein